MRSTWTSKWKSGQIAPPFTTVLENGQSLTHLQLLGKKYILFFYNHDGSETCTKEACNMRDNFKKLSESGYEIFGVSEDSMTKHQKFISKYNLPYHIISDINNELAKTFDIFGQKEFMGRISDTVHRTTFVINEKGIIESVIHPVDSKNHANQILDSLNMKS